jgi:hypothetical protein
MDLPIAERWAYIRLLNDQLDAERRAIDEAHRGAR